MERYGTEVNLTRLHWAINAGVFSGLTVTELLTNTAGHPAAWEALKFVLGGSTEEDVVCRLDPSQRRNLAASTQIDGLIDRTMR